MVPEIVPLEPPLYETEEVVAELPEKVESKTFTFPLIFTRLVALLLVNVAVILPVEEASYVIKDESLVPVTVLNSQLTTSKLLEDT